MGQREISGNRMFVAFVETVWSVLYIGDRCLQNNFNILYMKLYRRDLWNTLIDQIENYFRSHNILLHIGFDYWGYDHKEIIFEQIDRLQLEKLFSIPLIFVFIRRYFLCELNKADLQSHRSLTPNTNHNEFVIWSLIIKIISSKYSQQ